MKIKYILYVLKIVFLLSIARNEQSLYFQEACPTFLVLSWKHLSNHAILFTKIQ